MSKEVKRYDALRDSAKKATPGPWRIEDDEDSAAGAVYITQDTPDWREPIARLYGWHDQNYLELADPTTILGLLAERDALLAERDSMKKDAERYNLLASMIVAESDGAVMTPQQEALFGALNTITHLRTADEVHAMFDAATQETNP